MTTSRPIWIKLESSPACLIEAPLDKRIALPEQFTENQLGLEQHLGDTVDVALDPFLPQAPDTPCKFETSEDKNEVLA